MASINGSKTTDSGEITPQERSRIEASIRGPEQAPSTRQQVGIFANWKQVQEQLGQPFNNERVPLSKLKLMRRDPMFAFGLHYQKMPLVKAPWYMKSQSAQVAAYMDATIRAIISSLIITQCQKLEFGFQAMGKRFQLKSPGGTYVDPESGQEKPAWDNTGGIEPVTLKPFIALPPESVEPIFDKATGEFAGIDYTPPSGGAPAGVGAKSKGSGGSEGQVEIDLYHCQPAGERVLTFNRGWVPIDELDQDNDLLVVWDKKQKKIRRSKGFSFKKEMRPYQGDLIRVSADEASTRVTPNHKFTVRWSPEAQKRWAVYLMRKGSWWRIGITPLIKNSERKASGIGQRVSAEGADAAWILDTFDSKNEALYHEKLWQTRYKIPGLCFKATSQGRSEHCLTTSQLEAIWNSTESEFGALDLLADKKLLIDYPFFEPAGEGKTVPRGLRGWTCHAVNLVPGLMEIPRDPGSGQIASWEMIARADRLKYEGAVFSIDVPPHHHYITEDGIITQNSLWVTNELESVFNNLFGYPRLGYGYPYWWSYWYRWAIADRAFEKKGDPPIVVRHPEGKIDLGDGQEVTCAEYAMMIGDRLRAGAAIAMPSTPYTNFEDRPSTVREWEIEFLKGGVELDPFDKSFDYLDVMKLRSIFVPEQALIEGGGGTSSRNVAEEMFEGLIEGQSLLMDEIVSSINRWIIPHLLMINFPKEFEQGITCEMKVQGFASSDTELLAQLVQLIGQSHPEELGLDVREALRQLNMPMLSEKEYQSNLKIAAEQAAAQGPPVVSPTSTSAGVVPTNGRAPSKSANTPGPAGVGAGGTFTGFSYVPPVGLAIELSAVADAAATFIADLPVSTHYQDKGMKALTKQLWNAMQRFYSFQYADFADYVASQEAIQLSDDSDDSQEIDLAIPDVAREVGRKLVDSWRGDLDRLDEAVEVVSSVLEKMLKRASSLARKEASLDTTIDDEEARTWVTSHVSDLIANAVQTIRGELSDFVGGRFNDGEADPEVMAKSVRSHFGDFPTWKASRFARTEARDAFNVGTLLTGQSNGLSVAQAVDSLGHKTDAHCEHRDGQFFTISQALQEDEHPNGTLGWRLVKEPVTLARVDEIPGGVPGSLGAYDAETKTIYLSRDVEPEDESKFLLAIGEKLQA